MTMDRRGSPWDHYFISAPLDQNQRPVNGPLHFFEHFVIYSTPEDPNSEPAPTKVDISFGQYKGHPAWSWALGGDFLCSNRGKENIEKQHRIHTQEFDRNENAFRKKKLPFFLHPNSCNGGSLNNAKSGGNEQHNIMKKLWVKKRNVKKICVKKRNTKKTAGKFAPYFDEI